MTSPTTPTAPTTSTTSTTVGIDTPTESTSTTTSGPLAVQAAEFQSFQESGDDQAPQEINRFADIKVTVSGELGKAQISLERLLSLRKGSILELDRTIDSPIELVAQGIPLARGEVVVVDGHFAVQILEIFPRNRRGESLVGEQ